MFLFVSNSPQFKLMPFGEAQDKITKDDLLRFNICLVQIAYRNSV